MGRASKKSGLNRRKRDFLAGFLGKWDCFASLAMTEYLSLS